MKPQTGSYEASITGDAQSADRTSPISYVRELLGKTFLILLTDGNRLFKGTFSALDWMGLLAFRNVIELTENNKHEVGTCIINLHNIQTMEILK
jgi:small nuclear ribonucleoprotein (snRNP)-like protein